MLKQGDLRGGPDDASVIVETLTTRYPWIAIRRNSRQPQVSVSPSETNTNSV
jgi:hypothetical protein